METTNRDDRKRGAGWMWAVALLLLVGLVIWWVLPDEDESFADDQDVEVLDPGMNPAPTDTLGARTTLAAILADPAGHVGQPFPQTQVQVADVPTDRGFWVEAEGSRLFAIIVDEPQEQPKNIEPGQSLRIDGGTLRDAGYIDQIQGVPLDADTREIVQQQQVFLVVDESDIVMVDVEAARSGADPLEQQ